MKKCLMLPMVVWASGAFANPLPYSFIPKFGTQTGGESSDWALTCDNAGTCRADGYHSMQRDGWENGQEHAISMLLKRKAGHQKIEVFVNLRENPYFNK